MRKKKKVLFIANPFSGTNRKGQLSQQIQENLDQEKFQPELVYTKYAGHAMSLTKDAIVQGFEIIIAVGGDGSVNEIANALIGSNVILGVLPCGSGNGFAMHLGMGRNVVKAIQYLNTAKILMIDTCEVNQQPFVNLAGVGFDANVALRIKGSKLRGFLGYLKCSLQEAFSYQMQDMKINIDGEVLHRSCFAIEVANAPMYGYGFIVAPLADLKDGKLEVMILKKAPKWRYILEGWRFLTNSLHKSPLAERYTATEVCISTNLPIAVHFDGEGFISQEDLKFKIKPNSLKILCPQGYNGLGKK